jgi:hypothetical protein
MLTIYTHSHLCVHLQRDNSSDNGGQLSSLSTCVCEVMLRVLAEQKLAVAESFHCFKHLAFFFFNGWQRVTCTGENHFQGMLCIDFGIMQFMPFMSLLFKTVLHT